ncbi:cellulose synthase family protein [Chondrinema litorale]|uniref:cellulose synthase family protein n=1 Tax=Chondrinema litorale TaxID=2994555 RepID=UPI0025433E61|nr:cellulose synthase family protein [Chondrinema litorale]UZR93415.1 glycosyltransferase family 2 protein [Chondrinema litorale]
MSQLHLTFLYIKEKRKKKTTLKQISQDKLPIVTIQLPVFNELYVIERLIDSVVAFNYPIDKLEVQVLDDSTDQTVEIIANRVTYWQNKGYDIQHVRRASREGFKAGALKYGTAIAKGEFIAIFDADFVPEKDFLLKTLPFFENEKTGVVQTRWGHLNKDYSVLTKLQAFGLDAHFTIEQVGRSSAGSFINFNGTAGIWRKACIIDAGGWQQDTLTEDLDLSYRAQMKGWHFEFLEDVESPAELPVLMPAIKSQQFRWNKGAAETARKHLLTVLKTKITFSNKVHAFFHLLNSSIFVFLLFAAILSIPMLFVKQNSPELELLINIGSVLLFGFFSITLFYWIATQQIEKQHTFSYFVKIYPLFLCISMGLSLHNALAVIEGLLGFKSPFIRTPKFNITKLKDQWKGNIYIKKSFNWLNLLEGFLGLYFLTGIALGIYLKDYGLMIFHIMLSIGFISVFYYSIKATVSIK